MFTLLFVILLVLNLVDFGSSYYIFSRGFGREANKFMALMIQRFGLGLGLGLFLPKAAMLAVIGLITSRPGVPWFALAILCMVYVFVAYNNLMLIYRWKKKQR